MARSRGKVPLPCASSPDAFISSSDYYVGVDGTADWDLEDLNAADKVLQNTFLKTKFSELQKARRRADVVVRSSKVDVADFSFGRVTATFASDVSSNGLLRRTAKLSEFQMKRD